MFRKPRWVLPRRWVVLPAVFLAASAFPLLLPACTAALPVSHVAIEIATDQAPVGQATIDETNSTVLRCASFTTDGESLTAMTSKSKTFKATILVFILPATGGDYSLVAVASVTGAEYEYDLSQAKLYAVKRASADAAAHDYGMAYADWQSGAITGSDKFPCCE